MVYLKALESIYGQMEVFIREILSKVLEVVMGFGVLMKRKELKVIKDIIAMIKNRDMVFTNGRMVGHIKEISKMIIEMAMDSFMIKKGQFIKVIGKMENKHQIEKEAQEGIIIKVQFQAFNLVE